MLVFFVMKIPDTPSQTSIKKCVNQNTKYANQNTNNQKYANENIKYSNQNTKKPVSIKKTCKA